MAKFRQEARCPESVYIVYQARRRPYIVQRKVRLACGKRRRCSNEGKTRNPLKFTGVAQTRQQISAVSRQKFTILWEHVEDILLLNNFFPIVDMCLCCEDIVRQICAMVPRCGRWRFLATFCVLYIQRAARRIFQTCILNSH